MPLRGTANASRLVESELLGSLGIPQVVLFDDVRDTVLDQLSRSGAVEEPMTSEETKVKHLLEALRLQEHAGHQITFVPFPLPDVIAALPEAAINRAFPQRRGEGWPGIVEEWRSGSASGGFKKFAIGRLGVPATTSADEFVSRVVGEVRDGDLPAPELTLAVKAALARLNPGSQGVD